MKIYLEDEGANLVLYDDIDRIVMDLDVPTSGERIALMAFVEEWNVAIPRLFPCLVIDWLAVSPRYREFEPLEATA